MWMKPNVLDSVRSPLYFRCCTTAWSVGSG
jgi:hypothetical protein